MQNKFRINKINAKEEVEITIKEIKAIKAQLVETTGTNLLQQGMPRNLKLSYVRMSHTLSRKTILTILNLSWPKSKEKILASLLTATTMKMNSKYCKPLP